MAVLGELLRCDAWLTTSAHRISLSMRGESDALSSFHLKAGTHEAVNEVRMRFALHVDARETGTRVLIYRSRHVTT